MSPSTPGIKKPDSKAFLLLEERITEMRLVTIWTPKVTTMASRSVVMVMMCGTE